MKYLILFYLFTYSAINAHEASVELLQKKVAQAVKNYDNKALSKLYDWTNVHFIIQDQEMMRWYSLPKEYKLYLFKEVKWTPIKDFPKQMRKNILTPNKINGRTYTWNYAPIGGFEVIWSLPGEDNKSYSSFMLVGKNDQNLYVGISNKIVQGDKIINSRPINSANKIE